MKHKTSKFRGYKPYKNYKFKTAKPTADIIPETTGNEIIVHFDGGCTINPGGQGSYGFTVETLIDTAYEDKGSAGSGPEMTNNVAEWTGLRSALEYLVQAKIPGDQLLIFGDSQLVIRQLSGAWRTKKPHLEVFKIQCLALLQEIGLPWKALWVPRQDNKIADQLAGCGLSTKLSI